MPKNLDFEPVVIATIKRHSSADVASHSRLGDVLPHIEDRHSFRRDLHEHITSRGIHISFDDIPIEGHNTVTDVVLMVSALAGNTSTKDSEEGGPTEVA